MFIIGISAFYHDSAACLIKDGKIIAAVQEERFTRKKHDGGFPKNAIMFCLEQGEIEPSEIDNVVFYEKPFLKFERLIETYIAFAPRGFFSFVKAMPLWIKEKLFQKSKIVKELSIVLGNDVDWHSKLLFSEHHLSHAASAFYPSPFDRAAILTIDGVGEWTSTSLTIGSGKDLSVLKEIHFPHSLGLLYSAFTFYLGFKVNSGEYKVMGLAPFGDPVYVDIIKDQLIKIADDGSFQLDMSFFNFATGLTMVNGKFEALFGGTSRKTDSEITTRHMNLASSIQKVTEEIVVKLANGISQDTNEKNLCLAGGVALNCVVNGILLREKIFDKIWIQPASGDAGGALGAALAVWHLFYGNERDVSINNNDEMNGSYLGPCFSNEEIKDSLDGLGATYIKVNDDDLIEHVTRSLVDGKAIGWMQGRMEFGPRALGARSIIADPRSPNMQRQLNLKVKYRESFRPFAPSILREEMEKWFDHSTDSPYMLLVADLKENKRISTRVKEESVFGIDRLNLPRSLVPAITHIDYSARLQTVHENTNPLYHALIKRFNEKTGCPLLINTSFNVRGEPIICSPNDAFKCFMGTDLDALAIGNYWLLKKDQDQVLIESYEGRYELD